MRAAGLPKNGLARKKAPAGALGLLRNKTPAFRCFPPTRNFFCSIARSRLHYFFYFPGFSTYYTYVLTDFRSDNSYFAGTYPVSLHAFKHAGTNE